MVTERFVLGIDLGTQQFKAMVVSPATGQVVARAVAAVENYSIEPGMVEQDPSQWLRLLYAVGRRAVEESGVADRIGAIGVTGHMHTLVALNDERRPVHRAIVWNDARSGNAARRLSRFEPLWNPPISAYTLPKLLWMRERLADASARTRTIIFPKDYLRLQLTGELRTDPSDASGSLAWDFRSRAWDLDLLAENGLAHLELPGVLTSDTIAGSLLDAPAERLGVRPGVPVATGAGDVAAAVMGADVVAADAVLINAGTAAQVITIGSEERATVLARRHPDRRVGYLFELGIDDRLFVMGALPSAGHSIAWWRGIGGDRFSFEELDAAAAGHPLEPEGALFLPYLQGTGTPSMVDGGVGGFVQMSASEDFGRLTRAVIEGVAMGLRQVLDAMGGDRNRPSTIVVTGGLGKSATFCGTLSTLLGCPVEVRGVPDVSCMGAVSTAARATSTRDPAVPLAREALATYEPDDTASGALDARFERFVRWTELFVEAHQDGPAS